MSENKDEDAKTVECNISQLRGYFQAEEDIFVRNNALRMLDEIEIILKKKIEKEAIEAGKAIMNSIKGIKEFKRGEKENVKKIRNA